MDLDRAIHLIEVVLNVDAQTHGTTATFTARPSGETIGQVPVNTIQEAVQQLSELRLDNETRLQNDTSAEFLVRQAGNTPYLRPLWRLDEIEVRDEPGQYRYHLGRPSLRFALAIADKLEQDESDHRPTRRPPSRLFHGDLTDGPVASERDILDLFIEALRLTSLLIVSDQPGREVSTPKFQALADSFCFHIAYNLGIPLIPQANLRDKLRMGSANRLRRSNPNELDAPHQTYIPELVHSYQLALATDSPMLAYLSYYHVAEHWFEEVFQEKLANTLRDTLTSPSFSYKRPNDLQKLIKTISKQVQTRNDELTFNERNALQLTLAKFVQIGDLLQSLDSFNSTLLDHYASNEVEFCGGPAVDLRSASSDKVWGALAERIYKTRNALVHRKNRGDRNAGARDRFEPFKDDHILEPEVPLIRFIAEQILIFSGTVHDESTR